MFPFKHELVDDLAEKQENTERAGEALLDRFNQACTVIESRFTEAAQKLDQENKASRIEHAQLVETSRNHLDDSAKNRDSVIDVVAQAEKLLASIQEEPPVAIKDNLTQLDSLMAARLKTIEDERRNQVVKLESDLKENLTSFSQEVKKDLTAHQQGVDRQLTEFMGRQSMLIQNLTQHIDGFQRATQTLASEQQRLNKKIDIQQEELNKIPAQEAATVNLQEDIQSLDAKLGQVITGLQRSLMVGGLFKGL